MIAQQLVQMEAYSVDHRDEVLLVTVTVDGEPEEITIYRGFTSSLSRPTPPDPDTPVLPPQTTILQIVRVRAPFQPDRPQALGSPLTWEEFATAFCS